MCGIFCLVASECSKHSFLTNALGDQIVRRGPDWQESKQWVIKNNLCCYFFSSILWMQGESMVQQPVENTESIFLYNGNIYGGIPEEERIKFGDTLVLLKLLENANDVSTVLSNIQGPYSFVYLNKVKKILYFGRDHFGRISLLLGKNNDTIVLTSVAKKKLDLDFKELPSIGTFCWNLKTDVLSLLPFDSNNESLTKKVQELENFLGKTIEIKENIQRTVYSKYFEPQLSHIEFLNQIKNLNTEEAFKILLCDQKWKNNVLKLENLLKCSLRKRLDTQPKHCRNCLKDKSVCNHSLMGILFSGGVDCAVLAVLSDKVADKNHPIDLMNVSFNEINNYASPDRQTGIQTLNELQSICPDREWRFLEINISQRELNDHRTGHISNLIFPLQTVLDDSLGCALWFASRGSTDSYTSPCRVLLAGMGADELFGGYTKHRAAFKKGSWSGLHEALNVDWQNLPHRNHARDNRVVCDHGRELRIPYLDENVVQFVRSLPSWEKTCPVDDLPQGFGEKLLLRTLAYHLGLKNASLYKKRALQFGSRIANKKENAHEISERLL